LTQEKYGFPAVPRTASA